MESKVAYKWILLYFTLHLKWQTIDNCTNRNIMLHLFYHPILNLTHILGFIHLGKHGGIIDSDSDSGIGRIPIEVNKFTYALILLRNVWISSMAK